MQVAVACYEGESHLHRGTTMGGLRWVCTFIFSFCDKYGCQLSLPSPNVHASTLFFIHRWFNPCCSHLVRVFWGWGSSLVRPIKELVSGLKLVAVTCTYFTSCSQQGSKKPPGSLQEKHRDACARGTQWQVRCLLKRLNQSKENFFNKDIEWISVCIFSILRDFRNYKSFALSVSAHMNPFCYSAMVYFQYLC